MNTGFETIGNASLIIYDGGKPILSTDPWIDGYPYFGSWKQSYKIPNKQKNNMVNSKYIWISHGHPDHLDIDTIKNFKENKFLLANHYGDRIINDFNNLGLNTKKLIDKKWYNISKNIKIATYADFFQNSVLLIIIKDVLIINLNDCNNGAWKSWVKSVSKQFNKVFLLKLVGYGDADMINYYDEDDNFIYPLAEKKIPVGKSINKLLNSYQANFFIPFSSVILFSILSISFEFSISIKASSDFSLCNSLVRFLIFMLSGWETFFTKGARASSDLKHTPSQLVFPETILIVSSPRIRNSVPFSLVPSQIPSSKTSLKILSSTKASPVPSSFCATSVTKCKSKSSD